MLSFLSVSPIGSSPLQRTSAMCLASPTTPFSIPNRIEPSATLRATGAVGVGNQAFSIPNRIEPSATCRGARDRWASGAPFSIPNRIEPSATRGTLWHRLNANTLSVSPIGSSPLQRFGPWETRVTTQTFSIPNRIEPSATFDKEPDKDDFEKLSVSPIGSSPLQPSQARVNWTTREELSVSPIGSSPLQLQPVSPRDLAYQTFSIPNRIEPSATRSLRDCSPHQGDFQYPQSDRALCNWPRLVVRRDCRHSFSIPNRIEPSATGRRRRGADALPRLSVSPIGSSPLQLLAGIYPRVLIPAFSIPNRIEPSATIGGRE